MKVDTDTVHKLTTWDKDGNIAYRATVQEGYLTHLSRGTNETSLGHHDREELLQLRAVITKALSLLKE